MRYSKLFVLVTGVVLGVSTARAGVLQGLEMDVMEAGESASQATSRIALPRAGTVSDDGSPDYAGVVTEQALIGGERGGEAAVADYDTNGAPAGPEPGGDTVSGIDAGEPGPGELDGGGGMDDGGVRGEEPTDGDWVDPVPGDIGIDDAIEEPVEDPADGTPIGDIMDGGPAGGDDVATSPPEEILPEVDADGQFAE